MIGWLTGRFSSTILAYTTVGLLVALGLATAALGITAKLYVGAKAETAKQIEKCNTDKARSVAQAERIARDAEKRAADEREAQLRAQIAQATVARITEQNKRVEAEAIAEERQDELTRLAEDAFDEDEIPDSTACLNAFVTSRALRCVLHARDSGEAGAGGGGDGEVCADTGSADGVHPGFSNVTYLDVLMYYGLERDNNIRWNERAVEIRRIQNEVIDNELGQD